MKTKKKKISEKTFTIFVILIVYVTNLIAGVSFSWSSPELVILNGDKNNPLGYPITTEESGLIGSLFFFGAAIGPLVFIKISDNFGRKFCIIVMSLVLPIGYATLGICSNVKIYYVCRFILGISIGGICCTTPVYASEILPAEIRGSLMGLSSTFILSGSLLTYTIGPYTSIFTFNLIIALISLIFLIFFTIFCPESPYFAMKKSGRTECRKILKKLRPDDKIDVELDEIENYLKEKEEKSFLKIFTNKKNVKAFTMATLVLIFQQLSGINIVISYSQLIFQETKIEISSENCSIIVGALQLISSFAASLILDKFQRKTLLLLSTFCISLLNFLLSFYFIKLKDFSYFNYLPLIVLIIFVISDSFGNGPIPWILLGELYPIEIKSIGPALSTSIYNFAQFFTTYTFNKYELKYLFLTYGISCTISIVYIYYFLTETKGKTLKEINDELERKPLNIKKINKNVNADIKSYYNRST